MHGVEVAEAGRNNIRASDEHGAVLHRLIEYLKKRDYHFVTPTPATHLRVLARRTGAAVDLRDAFGWSLPFPPELFDRELLQGLRSVGLVESLAGRFKSSIRISSLGPNLVIHSAFPTDSEDSVFFGPDSYRFGRLIMEELAKCPARAGGTLVDIGTGAGAGALVAGRLCPSLNIIMTDINPAALQLARINAETAGLNSTFHLTADLSPVPDQLDLILANPPYLIDGAGRAYRDGGDMHGAAVSLMMAQQAVPRLARRGRFILYTGSAIVAGRDNLHARLERLASEHGCHLRYQEIDPDVFGEELAGNAYRDVERIALVGAVIERPGAES